MALQPPNHPTELELDSQGSSKMTTSEILQQLNSSYIKIESIVQSQEWQEICKAKNIDPDVESHLGDVLHYLSEAIACLDDHLLIKSK